jgi:hypothetical protein
LYGHRLAGIIPALGQQHDRTEAAAELDNLNSQLRSLQESEASLYAQVTLVRCQLLCRTARDQTSNRLVMF